LIGQERISNDMTSNKRRRHTPGQIIRKLAEGNKLLASGQELDEVCRHLEIAESTWVAGSPSTAA
jgi:putative transposase